MLVRRDRRFLYVLPFVAVPTLLYVPFQPVIRYCWLIYPALTFLGADLVARLVVAARWRFSHPRRHSLQEPALVP